MQFKHPELLWALLLLLIPVFIHLFQLRRFKKTPFTNVKLLQKVVSESRRSNTIKKWLLLATRLLLLFALVLAFAQPFFAKKTALAKKETVIYLDNSFSMEAKTDNETLLKTGVQELIKSIPKDNVFSLFTNGKVFRDVRLRDIQNDLLSLKSTSKQLDFNEITLKANTFFSNSENTVKDLILISDFQQRMQSIHTDSTNKVQKHVVQLSPDVLENVSVDTVYIGDSSPENIELITELSTTEKKESIPVSLYNDDKLIAKTSATFGDNKKATVLFSISAKEVINGKIEISDTGLSYDNKLYFNINEKEKIKALAINEANDDYLSRIFTNDEFSFSTYTLNNLNYSLLETQNIVVLNELNVIPDALQNVLKSFVSNGGSLVVVPSKEADMNSYNNLFNAFFSTMYTEVTRAERNITDIAFSHPLYTNVFEKEVTNFQYPKVSEYFKIRSIAPKIISFQDKDAFLVGGDGIYIFTASITNENSNFKNSPLIVPTFYSMGVNSLKLPKLYSVLGTKISLDVSSTLSKDNILKVAAKNKDYEFIPQQRSFANKVSLSFYENPTMDGIYHIVDNGEIIKNISFNHQKNESELTYLNMGTIQATTKQSSIASLFEAMEKDNRVTELWKWFVILALLFMVVEILIQKYLK
ncbi:MAG: BatA and WFA domain-containing protein [Bacteroidota bacterium]